jgi:hypothetical protein
MYLHSSDDILWVWRWGPKVHFWVVKQTGQSLTTGQKVHFLSKGVFLMFHDVLIILGPWYIFWPLVKIWPVGTFLAKWFFFDVLWCSDHFGTLLHFWPMVHFLAHFFVVLRNYYLTTWWGGGVGHARPFKYSEYAVQPAQNMPHTPSLFWNKNVANRQKSRYLSFSGFLELVSPDWWLSRDGTLAAFEVLWIYCKLSTKYAP